MRVIKSKNQKLQLLATIKHLYFTNGTDCSKNQKDQAFPTHGKILLD